MIYNMNAMDGTSEDRKAPNQSEPPRITSPGGQQTMPALDRHLQGSRGSFAAVDTPVLWHLEISHYNEKVRWALDYKGIPHVRRAVAPGLQEFRARRIRAGRTLPILQLNG